MNNFYIKVCLFSILLTFAFVEVSGQTIIWSEDFSSYSGYTGVDGGSSPYRNLGDYPFRVFKWTINVDNCTLSNDEDYVQLVNDERLNFHDVDGKAYWTTESINISSYTNVGISIDLTEQGDMDKHDLISCQYKLNGSGGWNTFYEKKNNFNSANALKKGLSGNTLQIRVLVKNDENSKYHRIDNVIVTGESTDSDIKISDGGVHVVDDPIRFYDSGGASSNYPNKEKSSISFSAPAGYDLVVHFIKYNTESGYDFLTVSDGEKKLGRLDDHNDDLEIVSSTGNLNFDFRSDARVTEFGWEAIVYKREKQADIIIADTDVNEGAGSATVRVSLSKEVSSDVSFEWCTGNDQARQPADYTRVGWTTVKINAGELYVDLKIVIKDDNLYEGDEKFTVFLKNSVNATISDNRISCTILDNENNASIEVDNSIYTAKELVKDVLVTGCVSVDEPSIKFVSGDNAAIGYFEKGASNFPLSSGIVISTGLVNQSVGPATNVSEGDVGDVPMADVDVAALTNSNGVDSQVLEFKFTPSGDMIEFNYVFASEEYGAGWECNPSYSDAFGFILIGDDGETNTVVKRNIALVPETDKVVSIYNVNNKYGCGDNTYYETNYAGFSTAFNGRTKVLTAKAKVKSCSEYTIRLIVSDKGDSQYDSSVFIEAGSFTSNEVVVENSVKDFEGHFDQMYEGCGSSYLRFYREDDIDVNLTFDLTIDGEAVNGVDYIYVDQFGTKLGDGKIPEAVTLLAGESEKKYYYQAVKDGVREDDESFRVAFFKGCLCSDPVLYEKTIRIIDVPDIKATSTTAVSCNGSSRVAEITIELQEGLRSLDYLYSVDGGDFKNNNVLKLDAPSEGSIHTVTIKDFFNCNSAEVDVTIPSYTPILANAGIDKSVCEFGTTQLQGGVGIVYEWTCNVDGGVNYLSDVTLSNPSVLNTIPPGDYFYTLTVKDKNAGANCVSTDVMKLEVLENAHFTVTTDKLKYCSGDEIELTSNVSNPDVKDEYLWTPTDGINDDGAHNTTALFNVSALVSKGFYLKITKSNGCVHSESVSGIAVFPNPSISLIDASSNLCSDGTNGEISINATGGTLGLDDSYVYSWDVSSIGNSSIASGLTADDYTVTVTDSKSCGDTKTFSVTAQPKPIGIFFD